MGGSLGNIEAKGRCPTSPELTSVHVWSPRAWKRGTGDKKIQSLVLSQRVKGPARVHGGRDVLQVAVCIAQLQ